MKVEEQCKISIKDWRNLTKETQDVVDEALYHLNKRQTIRPQETRQIKRWKNVLDKHYVTIDNISSGYIRGEFKKAKPEETKDFIGLKDRVKLSKQQVRQLSKLDFAQARTTLNDLVTQVKTFMNVGPHGPDEGPDKGSGKRGTGPKRGGRGRTRII